MKDWVASNEAALFVITVFTWSAVHVPPSVNPHCKGTAFQRTEQVFFVKKCLIKKIISLTIISIKKLHQSIILCTFAS